MIIVIKALLAAPVLNSRLGNGLGRALVFVAVVLGHRGPVPTALTAFPESAFWPCLRGPTHRTLILAVGLLMRAGTTKHPSCPLVHMIHVLIVASHTWKGLATAWKPKPTEALGVVLAGPIVWQWLTSSDTRL